MNVFKRYVLLTILIALFIPLTGCVNIQVPASSTNTPEVKNLPTNTPQPPTPVPTITLTPTPLAQPTSTPGAYIDDRSTSVALINSFFNAINRKEYLRAYSYWGNPQTSLGTLANFSNGYASTDSVSLVFGPVFSSPGAGQIYSSVPVRLKAVDTNGNRTDYAACYVTHLSQPGFYGEPPIQPMNIQSGTATTVDVKASDADVLAQACQGSNYESAYAEPIGPTSLDIGKDNYLDDRSDPIATVSSYLNALNRKEYVRAYSYSQDPQTEFGTYDSYAAGFTDTDVITAKFGNPISDIQSTDQYYKVPLAMTVQSTSGTAQVYVGCYDLHLYSPGLQQNYPFQHMGLTGGKFNTVPSGENTDPLLATACN